MFLLLAATLAVAPGKAAGTITIDGTPIALTHAVRTTTPNAFDENATDTVVVLSDRPLTIEEAADQERLMARGLKGELGPELRLAPGRYVGNFIVSAAVDVVCQTALPAGRVTPEDVSACQIVALDTLQPAMRIAASNVSIRGMTITGVAPDRTAVLIGSSRATDVTTQPANVKLDQNAILGRDGLGHRGIEAHGARVAITRNHIAGFLEQRRQSQG